MTSRRIFLGFVVAILVSPACRDTKTKNPPFKRLPKPALRSRHRPTSQPAPLPPLQRHLRVAKKSPPSLEEIKHQTCVTLYSDQFRSLLLAQRLARQELGRRARRSSKKAERGKAHPRRSRRLSAAVTSSALPSRESFIASCEKMPLDLIRCMSPRYQATMGPRCAKILTSLGKGNRLKLLGLRTHKGCTKKRRRRRRHSRRRR